MTTFTSIARDFIATFEVKLKLPVIFVLFIPILYIKMYVNLFNVTFVKFLRMRFVFWVFRLLLLTD